VAYYDDCVIFLLAKAYQKAHGDLKKRLQPYGLTPIQHLVLEALWQEEGLSAGEIGKVLTLDSATLSGVLDRMVEGEWIVKETNAQDKRSMSVYLKDKAKELKAKLLEERKKSNDRIMSGLSDAEKLLLLRMLKDIREPLS